MLLNGVFGNVKKLNKVEWIFTENSGREVSALNKNNGINKNKNSHHYIHKSMKVCILTPECLISGVTVRVMSGQDA